MGWVRFFVGFLAKRYPWREGKKASSVLGTFLPPNIWKCPNEIFGNLDRFLYF